MPVRHIDEIGDLYATKVSTVERQLLGESQEVGATQDLEAKDADKFKGFSEAGPEASEEFEPSPNDIKNEKKKDSAYNEEKLSNPVKMEENNINNSTMRENKSTFDRLYEDVMGDEEIDMGMPDDLGGEDELGGEEGGDTVTLELPREVAEQLRDELDGLLGGGEDEMEDLGDAEMGDEMGLEDGFQESHVELETVPDAVSKMQQSNNKVASNVTGSPSGGSASSSASGQVDGGEPKNQPEGFTHAKTKNNKVGGSVSGGNKPLFKA